MSSPPSHTSFISPRRILIIAGNTFTQLVRMKVFYFLLAFAIVGIGVHFLPELPHLSGPESGNEEQLRMMKTILVGMMKLFALILAIVATALLIPRDLEDRTLYTILAKPVPRLDYLIGKLLGVIMLIFVGMLVMTALLDAALHYRTGLVMQEAMDKADFKIYYGDWTEKDREAEREAVLKHGVTWSLQGAVLSVFFEASIIAALALLVSTFSSSTLFTVVISTLCFFIGQFIGVSREYWLRESELESDQVVDFFSQILFVVFPDFRPFQVADQVIAGAEFPLGVMGSLAITTLIYIGIYTVLSWFVFSDKEI